MWRLISAQCPVCTVGAEDIKHMLFTCSRAKLVWRQLGLDQIVHKACLLDRAGQTVLEYLLCNEYQATPILGQKNTLELIAVYMLVFLVGETPTCAWRKKFRRQAKWQCRSTCWRLISVHHIHLKLNQGGVDGRSLHRIMLRLILMLGLMRIICEVLHELLSGIVQEASSMRVTRSWTSSRMPYQLKLMP